MGGSIMVIWFSWGPRMKCRRKGGCICALSLCPFLPFLITLQHHLSLSAAVPLPLSFSLLSISLKRV